jgi:hypothetical protein
MFSPRGLMDRQVHSALVETHSTRHLNAPV